MWLSLPSDGGEASIVNTKNKLDEQSEYHIRLGLMRCSLCANPLRASQALLPLQSGY